MHPHEHVLERRHLHEEPDVLERAADAERGDRVRRLVGDVDAVEQDRARGRLVDPGELVEERRLAGAVRADQRDDRAARDREVDVVRRDEAAELLAQLGDLDQVVSHRDRVAVGEGALVLHVVERRVVDALGHLDLVPPLGDQPGRPEQHHQHDDDPVDPELVLRRVELVQLRHAGLLDLRPDRGEALDVQVAEDHAAENHAPDAAHAAEDDHAEQEHRDVEVEVGRESAGLEARVERAGDAAEERADRVRPGLRAHQRDAHRGGGSLVLADRDPGPAEPRVAQPDAAEDRDQQDHDRRPEVPLRPLGRLAEALGQAELGADRRRSRASRSG